MNETTVAFGPQGNLIGTVVKPDSPADRPGILFLNAGFIPRVGPNRLFVRMARLLGKFGYPSLRFDFSGVGDSMRSTGRSDNGNEVAEVRVAMDELQRITGCRTILLFGLCSSTDHCLKVAPADSRVAGLFLIDPFAYPNWRSDLVIRWHRMRRRVELKIWYFRQQVRQHRQWGAMAKALISKLIRLAGRKAAPASAPRRSWAAEAIWSELRTKPSRQEFAQLLTAVLEKNQRILIIYTSYVADEHNYSEQLQHVHPEIRRFKQIRTVLLPDVDHTISGLYMQEQLAGILMDWLEAK